MDPYGDTATSNSQYGRRVLCCNAMVPLLEKQISVFQTDKALRGNDHKAIW
jgi:hypothetical protein